MEGRPYCDPTISFSPKLRISPPNLSYSTGCSDADLTNWRFGDVSLVNGLLPFRGPDGKEMLLEPGKHLVLIACKSTDAFVDTLPDDVHIICVDTDDFEIGSNFNDDHDQLFLQDASGNEVDNVRYNCDDMKPPVLNCDNTLPDGATMERTKTGDNESFVKGPLGGTPGGPPSGGFTEINKCARECPSTS